MKKIALGVVAALLLAAFPVALAGAAGADTTATVRFINGEPLGAPAIDIYVDGVLIRANLDPGSTVGNFFDTELIGNGQHTLQVCASGNPQGLTGAGSCNNGSSLYPPGGVPLNLVGGSNYTIVMGPSVGTNVGVPRLFVGRNDISPTDYGFTRITLHNTFLLTDEIPPGNGGAAAVPGAVDLCVDGDKVLTEVAPATTQQVEVESQQQASLQIFFSAPGCPGPAGKINLVAGTNVVLTLVANFFPVCDSDCGQVLFVDQERHPNVANVSAFCAVVPQLATFQADFKSVLGNVDPNDSLTYPSRGAVSDLTAEIDSLVTRGDLAVPGEIKPQWEKISEGLRLLSQLLKLVDYDVSGFPVVSQNGDHWSLEQIVEAANGFDLPGLADPDLEAAISAMTTWFTANCAPAATPLAPAATPAAAGPKFTG